MISKPVYLHAHLHMALVVNASASLVTQPEAVREHILYVTIIYGSIQHIY